MLFILLQSFLTKQRKTGWKLGHALRFTPSHGDLLCSQQATAWFCNENITTHSPDVGYSLRRQLDVLGYTNFTMFVFVLSNDVNSFRSPKWKVGFDVVWMHTSHQNLRFIRQLVRECFYSRVRQANVMKESVPTGCLNMCNGTKLLKLYIIETNLKLSSGSGREGRSASWVLWNQKLFEE